MRRIALRIALGGLLLFILCVGLAGLALNRFDPDEYRDDIAHLLSLQIGRPVQINGPVQAFYYPWIGLEVRSISVPEADEDTPLLTVASIKLRVRLLPLLRKELVMDRVVAVEPEVWFRRDANGKSNWEELVRQTEARLQSMPEPTASDAEWLAVRQIVFSGFTVRGGVLHCRDEYLGVSFDAERIELKTGAGDSFPYELAMRVANDQSGLHAFLEAEGVAYVDMAQPSLVLEETHLQVRLRTKFLGREVGAALGGRLRLDSGAEAFYLEDAYLRSPGLRLEGRAVGKALFSREPDLTGEVSLSVPEPEVWLQPKGPLPREFEALSTAFTGRAGFALSKGDIVLSGLEFHLLDSLFAGQARISPGDSPRISLTVRTDSLDVDRLLSSLSISSEGEAGARFTLSSATETAKLLGYLEQVALEANVEAENAALWGERLKGVRVRLAADREKVGLDVKAEEYQGGRLRAKGRGRPGAEGWRFDLETDLKGAQAGSLIGLLTGARGWEASSGTVDISLSGDAEGETVSSLAATLSAKGEVTLKGVALTQPVNKFSGQSFGEFSGETSGEASGVAPGEAKGTAPDPRRIRIPDGRAGFSLAGPGRGRFNPTDPFPPYALEMNFEAAPTELQTGSQGRAKPFENIQGKAKGVVDLDLKRGSVKLRNARVEGPGGIFHGHVQAFGLFGPLGNATVVGAVEKSSVFPRELLQGMGISLPWAMNATALREGELLASFKGDSRGLVLKDLSLELDGDRLAGEMAVLWGQSGQRSFAWFDLESESINLDRYLPLGNQTILDGAPGAVGDWDAAFLNEFDFKGHVRIGTLRAGGLKYGGVLTRLEGAGGVVNATSTVRDFYTGQVDAQLALDVRKVPAFSVNAVFEGFDLRPALQDLFGEKNFAGRTTVRLDLESEGRNREAHVRSLSGAAAVRIRDGYYRVLAHRRVGTRNNQETRDIVGKTPEKLMEPPRTLFNKAEADFYIKQGVVVNDNFTLRGFLVKTNGEGSANLPENKVEYQLVMQTTALPSVVVRIHGPLDDPIVDVEGGSVMADTVKRMGGSVFDLFKNIFILPFTILDGLGQIGNDEEEAGKEGE